jgi:hypothetical protein
LGERLRPLEYVGVGTVIAGQIALSVSLSDSPATRTAARGVQGFTLALIVLALVGLIADPAPRRAIGLSIASGLLLGLAGVYAKALASATSFAAAVGSSDLLLTFVANLVGFALMQAALQAGRGVVVVPIFSTLSNLVPIAAGVIVYGESMPGHGMAVILRPLAFALALLGAALLAGLSERQASSAHPPSSG